MTIRKVRQYKKDIYTPDKLDYVCQECGKKVEDLVEHKLMEHKKTPEELEELRKRQLFYKGTIHK